MSHIQSLFEFIDLLHNTVGSKPSLEGVKANYLDKLRARFAVKEDYPFENAGEYQRICLSRLTDYLEKEPTILPYIHGDLWFSNILLDFKNNIKVIDMKGRVDQEFSMGGDRLYDYGKLYQSVLGYDLILYGDAVSPEYMARIKSVFEKEMAKRSVNLEDVTTVTFSLIMGTFHSHSNINIKKRVWDWLGKYF